MTVAVTKFIMLVSAHFPRQKFAGDEAREALWVQSMREMLSVYSDDVLMRAAEDIVRTRDPDKDGTMFPKPKECLDACETAKKALAFEATPLLETSERWAQRVSEADLWSQERINLARDLLASELGQRAKREGWADHLFHFMRINKRLPQGPEVAETIRAARAHADLLAELAEKGDLLSRHLRTYGASVQAHTRDLQEARP